MNWAIISAVLAIWCCFEYAQACGRDIKVVIDNEPTDTPYYAIGGSCTARIEYAEPKAHAKDYPDEVIETHHRSGPRSGEEREGNEIGIPYIITKQFWHPKNTTDKSWTVTVKVHTCPRMTEQLTGGTRICESNCYLNEDLHVRVSGAYCHYQCHESYNLIGESLISCGTNGWSNYPVCRLIDCGVPGISVDHGHWELVSGTTTTVNSVASLKCDAGFEVSGYPITTCQTTGTWQNFRSSCKDVQKPTFENCDTMNDNVTAGFRGAVPAITFQPVINDNAGKEHVTITYDHNSFRIGVNPVTAFATDQGGNTAKCQFYLTVEGIYCEELQAPENGKVHCSQAPPNLYGSECAFSCDYGYEIVGTSTLNCSQSAVWSDVSPQCVEITCGVEPTLQHGLVTCEGNRFNDVCHANCSSGFVLQGPASIICQGNKTWSSTGVCKDIQPPTFLEDCQQKAKEVFASIKGQATFVNWTNPQVSDNSLEEVTVVSVPTSGSSFPAGATTVTVNATDTSGNSRLCHFDITVTTLTCSEPDLEPENRTFDKFIYHRSADGYVYGAVWNISCRGGYPQRGSTFITCDVDEAVFPPQAKWTWPGDYNAMKPTCLKVVCPDLNAPENGAMSCFQGTGSKECLISCNANYTVPRGSRIPNGRLVCPHSDPYWRPVLIAPNCSSTVGPDRLNIQTDLFYFTDSCENSIEELNREFIDRFASMPLLKDNCFSEPECTPDNVEVTCGPVVPATGRRKRSASGNFMVHFTFDVKIPFEDGPEALQNLEKARSDLYNRLIEKVKEGALDLPGVTIDEYGVGSGELGCDCDPGYACDIDSFTNFLACVGCGQGYYLPERNKTCYECPVGSYQGDEAAETCTPCPPGMSTVTTASVISTQCQEMCQPGYKSEDGFAPCVPCSLGTYQPAERATTCIPCSLGSSTKQQASTAADQCQVGDLVFIDKDLTYNFTTDEATLTAWMTLPLTTSILTITVVHSNDQPTVITFRHHGSTVEYKGGSSYPLGLTLRTDTWFHLAITNDAVSNAAKLYLNGQLMSSHPLDLPEATSVQGQVQGKAKLGRIMATDQVVSNATLQTVATTCSNDVMDTKLIQLTSYPVYAIPSVCDAVDDCTPAPCGEQGECENRPSGYVCHCQDRWSGDQCQTPPDYCENHACKNGATCVSEMGNYTCQCPDGFVGNLCQRKIGEGAWGEWGAWTDCTMTCGGGQQQRHRLCNNPPPQPGGQDCVGSANDTRSCGEPFCPVEGGWGNWTNWTGCSVSCGGGERSRNRKCDSPAPQHGGLQCAGETTAREACNTHVCPVNGGWGEWTIWTDCSASCEGGVQHRSRLCDNPPPAFGGNNCTGPASQIQNCNTHECPVCPSFPRLLNVLRPHIVEVKDEKNCTVECLPTYSWAMIYEPKFYCGPKTNFVWSTYPDVSVPLENPQCTKSQLPEGGQMQVSMTLDHPCTSGDTQLTDDVRKQIENNVASLPCASQPLHPCVTQVTTSCVPAPQTTTTTTTTTTATTVNATATPDSRRRRSAAEEPTKIHIVFEMTGEAKESNSADFNSTEYQQYLQILKATEESVKMLTDHTAAMFSVTVNGQTVSPLEDTVVMDGGYTCPKGHGQRHGFCVECPTGTHSADDSFCTFCPRGQYQNETGMASCKACPAGFTTETMGAYSVDLCTEPVSQPVSSDDSRDEVVGVAVGVSVAVVAVAVAVVVAVLYKMKRLKLKKLKSSMLSLNRVHPESTRACYE